MSLREYQDWEKFNILEPFLPERVDLAGALITSTMANINRGKGKKPFSIDDFMIVEKSLQSSVDDSAERELLHMQRVIAGLGGEIR
jgi:hypothetical protein